MKKIWLVLILLSQTINAQLDYDYDSYNDYNYNDYRIMDIERGLIESLYPYFFNSPNVYNNNFIEKIKIETKDFDLKKDKPVKKITFYKITTDKEKFFELEFLENGKIKYINNFIKKHQQNFDYQNKLEVRTLINNGIVYTTDSLFYDDDNKLIRFAHNNIQKIGDNFIPATDNSNYIYDKFGNLILRYNQKCNFRREKFECLDYAYKYFYYKDSIVEKRFSPKHISYDKNKIPDTLEMNNDQKKTYFLDNKKQVYKIIEELKFGSKTIYHYSDIEFNKKDKIKSIKRDKELLYKFEYDKYGKLIKAIYCPDKLTDTYEYNKNGDLVKANNDNYFYEYDKFGNYIVYKKQLVKLREHWIREIEYY